MGKAVYIEMDMLEEAKQVINCVYQSNGKYSEDIIVDTLIGLDKPLLHQYGTTEFRSYGSLKNMSDEDVRLLINYMVMYGYLYKSDDGNRILKIRDFQKLKSDDAHVIVRKKVDDGSDAFVGSASVENRGFYGNSYDLSSSSTSVMSLNEITVNAEQTPGQVYFYNYEELKKYISDGLSRYNNTAYTKDNIAQAERDLKALRKVKRKLTEKKKELETAYSLPIDNVKKQLDELINMVKEPLDIIDSMIKEAKRDEKKTQIMEYAREKSVVLGEYSEAVLSSKSFFNDRWLNVTYSENKWKNDIDVIIKKSSDALDEIEKTGGENKAALRAFFLDKLSLEGADKFVRIISKDESKDIKNIEEQSLEINRETVDNSINNVNRISGQETTAIDDGFADQKVGYKVLKIYGTEKQMLKVLRMLDELQVMYDEIENVQSCTR